MKKRIFLSGLIICSIVLIFLIFSLKQENTKNIHKGQQSVNETHKQQSMQEDSTETETETHKQQSTPEESKETEFEGAIGEDLSDEELAWASYNDVRYSVVKIDMGDFSGSGLIYEINDSEIVILSSGHLLSHYESGAVRFSNGAVGIGWVTGISDTYDAGFMKVYREELPADKSEVLRAVSYDLDAFENMEDGCGIFQVGSISGVAADFYIGNIQSKNWYFEEFQSYMLYNFCKAEPGMSGGGTFTFDGKLVGMIVGSYMEESCALPLPSILEAAKEILQAE